jgi:hypothetical protein
MTKANYRVGGGSIRVTIRCGFAEPGAYELFLWEADRNSRVKLGEGNFINPGDDTFTIAADAGQNGKILQCVATINPLESNGRFGVDMLVEQDGSQLADEPVSDTSDLPTVTVALYVQLEA